MEYDSKDSADMIERTHFLFKFAQNLKWLSDTFGLCVVVVNQVNLFALEFYKFSCLTIVVNIKVTAAGFDNEKSSSSSFADVKPALGLAWAACINSRQLITFVLISNFRRKVLHSVIQDHAISRFLEFKSSRVGS